MLHRFDLHIHTYFSADAASSPEEVIAAAKARGLSGIAITDHDSCEAHEYLLAKGLEREDGEPVDGFLVVPGVEVSTADGHLLCLGTTLPPMHGEPAPAVVAAIHERGGIAVPAHPYDRWRAGIRQEMLDQLEIYALEVFNAAVTNRSYNLQALAYARSRGLSMTASSDAHHASAVAVSTTTFDLETLRLSDLLAALRTGGVPEGKYLSFREAMKKHFGNWFRVANRRPDR
ncbi:MAG TPA: CehA/McbA family metallohydrolase [Terrimicrobiaceae bacterium]|nr:CehA/McbA family metallohydrolase [Terrimicrobiaceae bacterium]